LGVLSTRRKPPEKLPPPICLLERIGRWELVGSDPTLQEVLLKVSLVIPISTALGISMDSLPDLVEQCGGYYRDIHIGGLAEWPISLARRNAKAELA